MSASGIGILLGLPVILGEADGVVSVETSFAVIRTMRDGHMMVFAAGVYLDKVRRDGRESGGMPSGSWCATASGSIRCWRSRFRGGTREGVVLRAGCR